MSSAKQTSAASSSATNPSAKRRSKKKSKVVKRLIGVAIAIGLVTMIGLASMPKPMVVNVAEVVSAPLTVTIDENGTTRVKDRFVVSVPITGDLGRLELRPGDRVAEGDVLLRIAPLTPQLMDAQSRAQAEAQVAAASAAQRQARASVARAEAARELGRQNFERTTGLANTGATSAQLVDQARFERRARDEEYTSATLGVRVADSQLRMARAALGRYTTRGNEDALDVPSPIAGQVLRVLHDQQGVVQPGTPIIEIGDPSHLEITIDVLTADAVAIEPGAPVTLERWGGEEALVGHVQRIEPSAFTRVSSLGVEEQRVNVVVDIDTERSVWAALGDGYRVEAHIQTWHEEDVVQIPSSALFRTDDGWALYRVNGEAVERVEVLVGQRAGLTVQVLEGISPGERVVVHPSESLADGSAVRVHE